MIDLNIELPDRGDHIIRTYDAPDDVNKKGLGHELFTNMKLHQDAIAQIDATTGEKDTYRSFLQRCVRTAMEMKARGVNPEDVVTSCTNHHRDSCVPFIATLLIGAKVASLDPSLSPNDTKHLLAQVAPKMIFVQPDSEEMISWALHENHLDPQIVVFGESKRGVDFSEFLKPRIGEDDFAPAETDDVYSTALVYFSSGTTGLPKGICINHFSAMVHLTNNCFELEKRSVALNFTTLYWLSCTTILMQCILTGSTRVFGNKFDPIAVWSYCAKYRVTNLMVPSTEIVAMLKIGRPDDVDLSNLKVVTTGGGPLSNKQMVEIRKMFPGIRITVVYGQTEVGIGIVTPDHLSMSLEKPGAVGRPKKGYWYKIVDPETEKILGPNQKGELRLKTKLQMNGYYNLDSSYVWDADGFLKTGDICYYDDDHYFYVVGRLKEMMKYRSWHVAPVLLEQILQEHPAVQVAVVVGLPHDEDGEHPMALIQLKPDAGPVSPEELVQFLDARVDDRKRLRGGVRFITDVPYTPTGKINRYALKKNVLGIV